jgi:hypothetical protein
MESEHGWSHTKARLGRRPRLDADSETGELAFHFLEE